MITAFVMKELIFCLISNFKKRYYYQRPSNVALTSLNNNVQAELLKSIPKYFFRMISNKMI